MVETRKCHKSVAINNKLFIIGGYHITSCDVFNATFNKFVLLKSPQENFRRKLIRPAEVISFGNKLVVFCDQFGKYSNSILFYDVDSKEWSEESWNVGKRLTNFSCAKVPQ